MSQLSSGGNLVKAQHHRLLSRLGSFVVASSGFQAACRLLVAKVVEPKSPSTPFLDHAKEFDFTPTQLLSETIQYGVVVTRLMAEMYGHIAGTQRKARNTRVGRRALPTMTSALLASPITRAGAGRLGNRRRVLSVKVSLLFKPSPWIPTHRFHLAGSSAGHSIRSDGQICAPLNPKLTPLRDPIQITI